MADDDSELRAALATVRTREPIGLADGKSGSPIERVTLEDGTVFVTKTIKPYGDWIMRNTHDSGRAAHLWLSGTLADVPPLIDHGIVGVVANDGGWTIVMHDLSDWMFADGRRLSRDESRRIIEAFHALHVHFEGKDVGELCPLFDRYTMLSLKMTERERDGDDVVPKLVARGWEIFPDAVEPDVAAVIMRLLDDPSPLVDALAGRPQTLIYGDLKMGNLGLTPRAVATVDWGTQTGVAPAAIEWAWYVAVSGGSVAVDRDAILDDVRAVEGDRHDPVAMHLALIGALLQLGWNKALDVLEHDDPAVRAREAVDLDWWVRRTRDALEAHVLSL